MSAINFHTKEISVKIVYYGPGLCGKTTSLQTIYASIPEDQRPQIVSLATEVDRTIFFDFLPVKAYKIRDFVVRLQLYTVPGQVFYNATRKLVLNGVDGVVFVCDSQKAMRDSNLESLQNLGENLSELGMEVARIPLVMQFNKRDLMQLDSIEEMDRLYNPWHVPVFATVATTGVGLFDTLRAISQLVVNNLVRKGLGQELRGGADEVAGTVKPPPPPPGAVAESEYQPSIASITQAATQAVSAAFVGAELWPGGDYGQLGARIDGHMRAAHWSAAVLDAEAFVRYAADQWGRASGLASADPVPSFLLLRGITSERYRTFVQAVAEARRGEQISRERAMAIYVLALQTVW